MTKEKRFQTTIPDDFGHDPRSNSICSLKLKHESKMVLSTPQGGEHIDENDTLLHLQGGSEDG
jgi:hypothetical protein